MASNDRFSSRWGFLLTAMGAAIGTGNIWRFPKEAAANGGGAFMIAWMVALFSWSIPLLMAEYAIGRRTRLGVIGSFKALLGKRAVLFGSWMVWIQAAIMFYYAVVMGWVLRYMLYAADGTLAHTTDSAALFENFTLRPAEVIGFQLVALLLAWAVCSRGIKGIEKANMVLLPILVVLLLVSMVWSLTLPGAVSGLRFLYMPDPQKLFSAETWIRAYAHSSWSVGVGMGMGITYGLYTRKKEDTSLNAFITGLGNNSVELIAGVAVLCTLFALSPSIADAHRAVNGDTTGLTFTHLSALFGTMPGGSLFAFLFFLATAFAALTSLIAGVEIITRNLVDAGVERQRALAIVIGVLFLFGIPSAVSIGFLNNQDFVWGVGLLVSGLFLAVGILRYGAERFRRNFINHPDSDLYIGRWWTTLIKTVIPIVGIVLPLWYFGQSIVSNPTTWADPLQTASFATVVVQWFGILLLLWYFNDRIADRMPHPPADAEIHTEPEVSADGAEATADQLQGTGEASHRIRRALDALRGR